MQLVPYVLLALAILLLMVLIHEAGHYTAAKILGFTVDEFAIGFGPKLLSKRRKNGELISLRMLPLGGFCAFYGENDVEDASVKNVENNSPTAPESDPAPTANGDDLLSYVMRENADEKKKAEEQAVKERVEIEEAEKPPVRLDKNGKPALTYNMQKPWKRIIVLLGGVTFNFLSAIIFSLIYIWAVGFSAPQVVSLYSDPAGEVYCPDILPGDIILAVDGEKIGVMNAFADLTADIKRGDTVTLTVDRKGEITDVKVVSRQITAEVDGEETTYDGFGFRSQSVYIGNTAGNAFKYCVPYTFKLSWSILGSFGNILIGKESITSMTGPIGSIGFMAEVTALDWRNILILLPLLASNLAIFNILPFPALDGAHVVFTVIEWIRKKPINRKVEGMIHFIGLAVLLLFVCIVDILSFAL